MAMFLHLLGVLILPLVTKSTTCKRLDDCRCQLDSDGSIVDLWPLGHRDYTPLFQDFLAPDDYRYSYNPCYPFNQGSCLNSGICRLSYTNSVNLATNRISYFGWDGQNVLATYVSSDNFTILVVTLECDPTQTIPAFQAYGQEGASKPLGPYNFKMTTQCACGNGCTSKH